MGSCCLAGVWGFLCGCVFFTQSYRFFSIFEGTFLIVKVHSGILRRFGTARKNFYLGQPINAQKTLFWLRANEITRFWGMNTGVFHG